MKHRKLKFFALANVFMLMSLISTSCSTISKDNPHSSTNIKESKERNTDFKTLNFIIMEKNLSDQPDRARTTMKVILPEGEVDDEAAMKATLEQARQQDKELKAVIIWAYRKRSELNASSYTVGKLEWSADGKDFNGTATLSPNPKVGLVNN